MKSKIKQMIKKVFKVLILIAIISAIYFFTSYNSFINNPFDKDGKIKVFTVKTGQSVKSISASLREADLIKSELFFNFLVDNSHQEKNIKAGNYELSAAMSPRDILEKLSSGKVITDEQEVKILEGWTRRNIAEEIKDLNIDSVQNFYTLAGKPLSECQKNSITSKDYSKDFDFLSDKPVCMGLEGYLFPDTYRIYKNASSEELIRKMLDNFDKKLTSQMREDIKKQGKSIYEIVTMASIVEKEVQKVSDMRIVAGIFWNRLDIGMTLGSDATLSYVLDDTQAAHTLEQLKNPSLYNTYNHAGLPPGPISNPGIEAITATIYPAQTDYFYFLSRSDNGETIFSKTYEEHLRNKDKYLR